MSNVKSKKEKSSPEQREALLRALKARFEKNMNRHRSLEWAKVQAKLEANPEKLWSLNEMEITAGEPSSRYCSSDKSSMSMAAAISIALFFGLCSFLDSSASRS